MGLSHQHSLKINRRRRRRRRRFRVAVVVITVVVACEVGGGGSVCRVGGWVGAAVGGTVTDYQEPYGGLMGGVARRAAEPS